MTERALRNPSRLVKGPSILKTKEQGNSIHIYTLPTVRINNNNLMQDKGYLKNIHKLTKKSKQINVRRTRVSPNAKAYQLSWLKTKKFS